MSNPLEDIKQILLESREAWSQSHKELISSLKGDKVSETKGAGDKLRGAIPDFQSIMPQDMRLIFNQFGNTLKQIFGGTNLAKFETTLKQTFGKMLQGGGGDFAKQAAATAVGARGGLAGVSGMSQIDQLVQNMQGKVRYGFRSVKNISWLTHFPNVDKKKERDAFEAINALPDAKTPMFVMRGLNRVPISQFDKSPNESDEDFKARMRAQIDPIIRKFKIKGDLGGFGSTGGFEKQNKQGIWEPVTGRWPDNMFVKKPTDRWVDLFKRSKDALLSNSNPYFEKMITTNGLKTKYLEGFIPSYKAARTAGKSSFAKQAWGMAGGVGSVTGITAGRVAATTAWTTARAAGSGLFAAGRAGLAAGATALGGTVAAVAGLSNPIGWAIAIAAAIPAVAGFTEILYKSQNKLKDINASIAFTFARSEVNALRRNLKSGKNREMVTGWLQYQSDAFKENMRPFWDLMYNFFGVCLAGIMAIVNALMSIYNLIYAMMNPIETGWGVVKGIYDWLTRKEVDTGPFGNFLRDMGKNTPADEKSLFEEYRDAPFLFDWGTI